MYVGVRDRQQQQQPRTRTNTFLKTSPVRNDNIRSSRNNHSHIKRKQQQQQQQCYVSSTSYMRSRQNPPSHIGSKSRESHRHLYPRRMKTNTFVSNRNRSGKTHIVSPSSISISTYDHKYPRVYSISNHSRNSHNIPNAYTSIQENNISSIKQNDDNDDDDFMISKIKSNGGGGGVIINLTTIMIMGSVVLLSMTWIMKRFKYLEFNERTIMKIKASQTQFKSGDLLLFCTRNDYFTRLIHLATKGPYNHVGIVYVDPRTKSKYLWEVTEKGATLNCLYSRIGAYKGLITLRSISAPVNDQVFRRIIQNDIDVAYNSDVLLNFFYRVLPQFSWQWQQQPFDENSKTCSQIVLDTLCTLGVIRRESIMYATTAVTPADFAGPLRHANNKTQCYHHTVPVNNRDTKTSFTSFNNDNNNNHNQRQQQQQKTNWDTKKKTSWVFNPPYHYDDEILIIPDVI